jgi:hypothetical protein
VRRNKSERKKTILLENRRFKIIKKVCCWKNRFITGKTGSFLSITGKTITIGKKYLIFNCYGEKQFLLLVKNKRLLRKTSAKRHVL